MHRVFEWGPGGCSVGVMKPWDPLFLRRLLSRSLLALLVGALFGGLSTGWIPHYMKVGGLIGLVYVLPSELGIRAFRAWRFTGHHPDPRRAGTFFVLKLLAIWALAMAVILPLVHWGLGIPVLRTATSALPHMAISLAWVAVLLVGETATQLYRTATALARSEAQGAFLALRAQLQPHTLFNALNTIGALARTQPERAEEGTRRLAGLLRGVMQGLDRPEWDLASEFRLVEDLLHLESLRFAERLTWDLVLPEALRDRKVPPLLLLPLVENAFKHGFRPKVGPCRLSVVAEAVRERVQDDGVGRRSEAREGVGLRTVRERVETLGGRLAWPEVEVGCAVEVQWP